MTIDERGSSDIHIVDVSNKTTRQLTFTGDAANPVWVDESRLLFSSGSSGEFKIQSIPWDRGTGAEVLQASEQPITPVGMSPDRNRLVFNWFEELKRLVPTGR